MTHNYGMLIVISTCSLGEAAVMGDIVHNIFLPIINSYCLQLFHMIMARYNLGLTPYYMYIQSTIHTYMCDI